MISGTPAILGILAVREGAAVIAEAGIDAIRAKIVALTEMVVAADRRMVGAAGLLARLPAGQRSPRRTREHHPGGCPASSAPS